MTKTEKNGETEDTPNDQNTTTTQAKKIHDKWSIFRGGAPVRFYVNAFLSSIVKKQALISKSLQ